MKRAEIDPLHARALGVLHHVHAGVDVRNLRDRHGDHLPSLSISGSFRRTRKNAKKIWTIDLNVA